VTLVLGGVRSGKSRFALEQAEAFARVAFVATAIPSDAEMAEKIRRHQSERPKHWETVEEPLDLGKAIETAGPRADLVLVDCLTIFAANLLEETHERASSHIDQLLAALKKTPASVVLVSNEVGSGVVPAYPAGRQFRDLLGELNQRVAAIADTVVLLVAGLPLALKGEIGVRA
jgi:adenosylcobinamide kinase/adenosylcobinamide-phosphate guanylyltransferase